MNEEARPEVNEQIELITTKLQKALDGFVFNYDSGNSLKLLREKVSYELETHGYCGFPVISYELREIDKDLLEGHVIIELPKLVQLNFFCNESGCTVVK